jgi:recombination protein RecT
MTTAMTTKQKSAEIRELLEAYREPILDVLPDHIKPERAMRVLQTACTRIPKLLDCSKASLLTAMVTASEFDLEPNTPLGQCFIIPYKGQATFQMGYQGMIELSYRTTSVAQIIASQFCENDAFEYSEGTESILKHTPAFKDRGEVIGYYAIVKMKDGANFIEVMSKDDCHAHGKRYSKAYGYANSGWQTAPDAMCKKTCIIQALKYAPKSIVDKEYEVLLRSCTADTDVRLNARPEPKRAEIDPDDLTAVDVTDIEVLPGGSAETAPKPDGFAAPNDQGELL